jgi:hypothetical protein
MNFYKASLSLIRTVIHDETLVRILTPLGQAIEICHQRTEGLTEGNDTAYIDLIIDNETEAVENLLGTAFISCQTFITNIVSEIILIHKNHNKLNPKNKLKTTGDTRLEILSFGEKLNNNSKYTSVQIIDAVANYYKHRDEWSFNWGNLSGKSAKTAEIIMSVGASTGCTGNLRMASRVLGNPNYIDTFEFYKIIYRWCINLHDDYKKEIEQLKLI